MSPKISLGRSAQNEAIRKMARSHDVRRPASSLAYHSTGRAGFSRSSISGITVLRATLRSRTSWSTASARAALMMSRGLDAHQATISVAVLDSTGKVSKNRWQ